jgi:hypothetical protein
MHGDGEVLGAFIMAKPEMTAGLSDFVPAGLLECPQDIER